MDLEWILNPMIGVLVSEMRERFETYKEGRWGI